MSVNLLTVHRNLRLTLLLAPSVAPRVVKELRVVPLSTASNKEESAEDLIGDRLQLINVTNNTIELPDHYDVNIMAQEAMDFAQVLPAFLKPLFQREGQIEGTTNKFQGLSPKFIVFDVSSRYTYSAYSQMG